MSLVLKCKYFVISWQPMITVLVNCSNLKKGGGLQVADSICCDLNRFVEYRFIVVLSSYLQNVRQKISSYSNCIVKQYDLNNRVKVLLSGRDSFLDALVENNHVDVVLSVFGPISWKPRCPHLCGFARPHLVLQDSPFFRNMSLVKRIKEKIYGCLLTYFFRRGVDFFYTESSYITEKWQKKVGKTRVYTITNYYNQVFDHPESWKSHSLPAFDGVTILCITAYYPHKNLEIALDISKYLKKLYPKFHFRFVFTIGANQYPMFDEEIKSNFYFVGRIDVNEAPALYQQATIMFQPSLLECFSATYPEAMRMGVPIVAADMGFARSLCGEAAKYYDPMDAKEAAEVIYWVSNDEELRHQLIENGKKQLLRYDTYEQRTNKLVKLVGQLYGIKKTKNDLKQLCQYSKTKYY